MLLAIGPLPVRLAAAAYASVCVVQIALTEAWLDAPAPLGRRLACAGAFPLACTLHGIGGFIGAARLWLDAMLDPAALALQAEAKLRQLLALRYTQGAV